MLQAFISNTVNVTTPPAVVISSHIEGSKSIADCSPISLDDSPTSDPNDTESPPPVTPSDSQTHEPITTPPAVVISSHVEGSKSIVDCSPISLDDSPTNDPSDTESSPPVTPSDSQTHEPITTKPISRPNNVSILDFDLNTLTFPLLMGDSKYDDDDDDLSGLELVYPDNVC